MYDDDKKEFEQNNDGFEQNPMTDEHAGSWQQNSQPVNMQAEQGSNSGWSQNAQPEQKAQSGWSQNAQPEQNTQSGWSQNAQPEQNAQSGWSQNAQPEQNAQTGWSQNPQPGQNTQAGSTSAAGQAHRSTVNRSYIPQERPEQKRKKGSVAGKAAMVTAAALLFGTVAGGTMFGVNTLGEYMKKQYAPQLSATETEAQVTLAEPETGASSAAEAIPAIQTDVSSIVEKAMPSVVAINNTMSLQQQTWFGMSQTVEVPSSGSGIIVGQNDDELLIVTNNHVVEDSKELTVTFIDSEQVAAAIKGTDSESDLAVIAVPIKDVPAETMSQIKVATMGDSDSLKVGQGVIAIGNALGYGQSVTVGFVSALDREVKADDYTTRHLLQTDAAINPGNSGGALLNMRGELIGINAAKYSSTEVEGMGYAIPISQAQDIINELMNKKTRVEVETAKQGYLGIQGQNIDETAAQMYGMPRGIYVYKIVEDGAAAASDLREKDIITKFDGQTVRTMADLKQMLTYYEGGNTVTLTVQSLVDGQYTERNVEITLGTRPAAETN